MKKFILVLILLSSISAYAFNMSVIGSASSVSGEDYTDIIFWLSFEDTWSSPTYTMGANDYSSGDSVGTGASAADVNADAALIGSAGLDSPTASDYITFTPSSNDIYNFNDCRIGFWFYIDTTWANTVSLHYTEYDSQNFVEVYLSGGDELSVDLRVASSYDVAAATVGENLAVNTAYFCELILDQTGNGVTLKIDGHNTTVASDAYTSFVVNADTMRIGNDSSTAASTFTDNVMISNDISRDLNLLKSLTTSPR